MNTLVRGCSILSDADPHGYRQDVDILIEGSIIREIGSISPQVELASTIDGTGLLAIPGLTNAHTHSPENAIRATSERIPLEIWLLRSFLYRNNHPPSLTYLVTLIGAIEMVRTGTTSVLDHFLVDDQLPGEAISAAFRAYSDLGMRATVAPMLEDSDFVHARLQERHAKLPRQSLSMQDRTSIALQATEEAIDQWHGAQDDTLRCMPGPGGPQWCSDELIEGSVELSERYSTGLHAHVSETQLQSLVCNDSFGMSGIQRLDGLGFLTPRTSLAHCVWIGEPDIETIRQRSSIVVHNPVSNLKLGAGIAPILAMSSQGIPIALGTDGAASNDSQDMWSTMKTACLIHSPATPGGTGWLGASDALRMATVGGAEALGMATSMGRIRPGNLADLVLVDLKKSYIDPLPNAPRYLIYTQTPPEIAHVFINGKHVLRNGQINTVDESDVRSELRTALSEFDRENPRPLARIKHEEAQWQKAIKRYERRTER